MSGAVLKAVGAVGRMVWHAGRDHRWGGASRAGGLQARRT